jgi:hypothetical protein
MSIAYPPVIINEYLSEKIGNAIPNRFSDGLRFFPTQPTDIDSLTEGFPEAAGDVFAVYDRMFKLRRGPFPHIKQEQLLYYFYKMAGDPEALIETSQLVSDFLDNGDESAQDINSWMISKVNHTTGLITFGTGNLARSFKPIFFHELRVLQLQETRDVIDFGTARTYAGNKIIIDYSYHVPA